MLPSDGQVSAYIISADGGEPAAPLANLAGQVEIPSSDAPTFDEAARARLAEKLNSVAENVDPVTALGSAIETVADELSRGHRADEDFGAAVRSDGELEGAIDTLVGVALEMDDPVTALEEGAESLAEALAARDIAAQDSRRAARERQIDEQAAYHHARFHRVNELIDVGYSLDQAVAITKADEADIRARAAAAGRNPMEPIYRYAVLNGYRGVRSAQPGPTARHERPLPVPRSHGASGSAPTMEALAQLSDDAFAEATKGDRWQTLMRR